MSEDSSPRRFGYAAVAGRPNVGKSTLVNRLVGHKFSITSRKAQTTRHRLLGIRTRADAQIVYVDTPGLHAAAGRALNRYMNRAASGALAGVDVALLVIEPWRWTEGDSHALEVVAAAGVPIILVVNKVDRIRPKDALLPFLAEVAGRGEFAEVIPVSARSGTNLDRLEELVVARLPAGEPLYDEDQFTDRSERFLAAEIIREKLTDRLAKEIPYRLSVEIERFEAGERRIAIAAVIWVERPSHKAIVIGQDGRLLKAVGTAARVELEQLLGRRVFLELWVKIKAGWSDDERALQRLGYED